MSGLFTCIVLLPAGALALSPSQSSAIDTYLPRNCELDCEACNSPFYNISTSGTCLNRTTSYESHFHATGYNCKDPRMKIRDMHSCVHLAMTLLTDGSQSQVRYLGSMDADLVNHNGTAGCTLSAVNGSIIGAFGLSWIEDEVCFGLFLPMYALATQLVALVLGVLVGAVSHKCSRNMATHFISNMRGTLGEREVVFAPGAKAVAVRSMTSGSRGKLLLLWRICQVIANVWLPMVVMWIVSPLIVLPLWFLLYLVPPLLVVGVEVFSVPQYVITPPRSSFFGINHHQRDATWALLFSLLRPIIFLVSVHAIGSLVVHIGRTHGYDDSLLGNLVINPVGYWRAGMQTKYGDVVTYFSSAVTIIGTLLHILMTIPPVAKRILGLGTDATFFRLTEDKKLRDRTDALAQKIRAAAALDHEDDQDRVADLEVDTLSKFEVYWFISLAIIDLGAYIYKIYSFLGEGRYALAAIMAFALSEALTTLVLGKHLQNAARSMSNVIVTGVPSVHFMACLSWDDGLAGIPCLFMTVYGLPLVATTSWLKCIVSIFFLCTGTKALAGYLMEVTDGCVFGFQWMRENKVDVEDDGDEEEEEDDAEYAQLAPSR